MTHAFAASALLFLVPAAAFAQAPVPALTNTRPVPPPAAGTPPTLTVILRERTNATQWFAATPHDEVYGHQDSLLRLGLQQRIHRFDYQLELGQTSELFLPTDAVSPIAAQGQLGLGGTFYAANGNVENAAAASFRQGFLRYHFRRDTNTLRLGRFEFFDGQETTPKDPTLLWLQTNRIAQRLVGNFGFTSGQRSFDGVDGKAGGSHWNLTAMAGRPTQGVYNTNANPELNVDIQYLAFTRSFAREHVLARGFALGYHDGRTGLTKTDNRPMAVRALDHHNIRLGTYGADIIASLPVGKQTADLLFWGVLQNGQWGVLDHRAGAFAAEAGLHFTGIHTAPWIRGGALRSTGDSHPADGTHNTFFQVLPTPRQYARFPFFNNMNSTEEFVQVLDKPAKQVDLRADLHFLQLTAPADFWYSGGGAFDRKVFGYTGRPGNNHASFGSFVDISTDYAITKQIGLTAYYAHVFGKSAIAAIYPRDRDANYGFFELNYRFTKGLRTASRP